MRPNVRGEAGPTVLRLARAVHHVPQALRGQGAMPLGLASTDGLGHAREAACGQRAQRRRDWLRRWKARCTHGAEACTPRVRIWTGPRDLRRAAE